MNPLTEEEAVRLTEYVDGEMTGEERSAFEAELAREPHLQAALAELQGAVDALGALSRPSEVDLAEGVQSRIRRRSRGRYFGRHSLQRERVQTQIFISLALAILAAAILLASPYVIRELFAPAEFELIDDAEDSAPASRRVAPASEGRSAPSEETQGAEAVARDGDAEAMGVLPLDGSLARQGAVSRGVVAPMEHREFAYAVRTNLDSGALELRLVDQFGRQAVRAEEGIFRVAVQRADVAATIERVGDLGPVTREVVPVVGARTTLDITFVPMQ